MMTPSGIDKKDWITIAANSGTQLAKQILDGPGPIPEDLSLWVEAFRQAGALEAAAILCRAAASDPASQAQIGALHAIFDQRPVRNYLHQDIPSPVPFIRGCDFLPSQANRRILELILKDTEQFRPAVVQGSSGKSHSNMRSSQTMSTSVEVKAILLPAVIDYFCRTGCMETLGCERANLTIVETEVCVHRDGGYYRPHRDTAVGISEHRIISFVYYLCNVPQTFEGGDLIIYDSCSNADSYASTSFTRLRPENNCIVFFPSWCIHEVEKVTLSNDEIFNGRLSVAGWLGARIPTV